MTNEELFDDLKQFIAATVSQEVAGLRTDLRSDIKTSEERLGVRIDQLDNKLDTIHDAIAEVVQDHETRIARLEQQRA